MTACSRLLKIQWLVAAGLLANCAFLGIRFLARDQGPILSPAGTPSRFGAAKPPAAAEALSRLKDGNVRFSTDATTKHDITSKRREKLAGGQAPFAVVLTCADSRVAPEYIFDQGLGDLFVVRVAGNIADPYELGSIEYAIEHLHVPLVVVLGHEKCGAVEAALGKSRPEGNLGKLISEIHVGTALPDTPSGALAAAVEHNARFQAHLLAERSPVLRAHLRKQDLRIVSGVYHLASGKVEWLGDK